MCYAKKHDSVWAVVNAQKHVSTLKACRATSNCSLDHFFSISCDAHCKTWQVLGSLMKDAVTMGGDNNSAGDAPLQQQLMDAGAAAVACCSLDAARADSDAVRLVAV